MLVSIPETWEKGLQFMYWLGARPDGIVDAHKLLSVIAKFVNVP